MAERADADRVQALAEERLQREEVGRGLGGAVWRDRPERRFLGEGEVRLLDPPVLLGAQHHDHARDVELVAGVQDVQRSLGVDPERSGGARPALADVAERGEVVHDLGTRVGESRPDLGRVGDVERVRSVPVEREHVVAGGLEMVDEMRADEAARAGDGNLHAVTPRARRYAARWRSTDAAQV